MTPFWVGVLSSAAFFVVYLIVGAVWSWVNGVNDQLSTLDKCDNAIRDAVRFNAKVSGANLDDLTERVKKLEKKASTDEPTFKRTCAKCEHGVLFHGPGGCDLCRCSSEIDV